MITLLLWFLLAFALLWIGSGIAVRTILFVSHSLHTSSFFVSFFILGAFTSIPEITIGLNAFIEKKPEIFVGNLLGASVVLFLLVIPLLAVFGKGLKLNHSFKLKEVITATLVVGFPALLTLDNFYGPVDALACVVLYLYFVLTLDKKNGLLEKIFHKSLNKKTLLFSGVKLVFAITLVFIGGHILVEKTPQLGTALGISPFIVGILVLSVGTNVPELTIAIRSVVSKQKDVAFGNYLGSAAFNSLEMALLTLAGRARIPAEGSNFSVMAFALGLILFLYFVKSKSDISIKEGAVLLTCYMIFVLAEIFTGPGWSLKTL